MAFSGYGSQYVEVIGHLHDERTLQEFKSTDFGESFGERASERRRDDFFCTSTCTPRLTCDGCCFLLKRLGTYYWSIQSLSGTVETELG